MVNISKKSHVGHFFQYGENSQKNQKDQMGRNAKIAQT